MTFNRLITFALAFGLGSFPNVAFTGPSSTRILNAAQIKNGAATITLPTSTGTVATHALAETFTNKNISGATNTFSLIPDTSLNTITTAGKVSNLATSAASANTASAIVARDGSGNFSAGTVSAALTGNASTATALAADPADCGSNLFADTIAASGALSCTAINSKALTGNWTAGAYSANFNSVLVGSGVGAVSGLTSITNGASTLTIPTGITSTVAAVSGSTFSDLGTKVAASADATKLIGFDLSGQTTGKTLTIASVVNNNVTYTIPNGSVNDTFMITARAQTVSNKGLIMDGASENFFQASTDATKKVDMLITGATASTKTTLAFNQTTARTITFPDATTTVMGTDVAQVVTAKDIDGATASNTSRITLPKASSATLSGLTRKQGTVAYDTTLGALVVDTGSAFVDVSAASVPTQSDELTNVGLGVSVGSSALTVALKQSDGVTDCSTGTATCKIGFRGATAASGAYATRSVTSSLSVTASSGSAIGHTAGSNVYYYVWAIDNAGTPELALSGSDVFDQGSIQNTTAEGGAGAADAGQTLYSTTARTGVGVRLIGRLKFATAPNGAHSVVPSEISLWPFKTNIATGDYVESVTAPTIAFGNGTWGDATSIVLSPGEWDVSALVDFTIGTAVGWASSSMGISTTSGNSTAGLTYGSNRLLIGPGTGTYDIFGAIPNYRMSITTTTTVYLKSMIAYSSGAPGSNGVRLSARRIR